MTLSSAFNIINTSFSAIATQSALIAGNIANANTPGYSTQIANVATDPFGGVAVYSVSREADAALAAQFAAATSDSGGQTAIAQALAALARTVSDSAGVGGNGASPYAMISAFSAAMTTYEADPGNINAAQAAVAAAKNVTQALNAGANAVSQIRTNADKAIGQAVDGVNSLLQQFQSVNDAVMSGLANGANVGSLQDQRDSLVSQIAQQMGVHTTMNGNGSMSIYTDSGVALFQNIPHLLSFTPSGQMGPNSTGGQITVGGVAITGPGSNQTLQSGAIAGLMQVRDTIAPQYQTQLDQIAGNLITAFQETDQSLTNQGLPPLPGLFTAPGLTGVPTSANFAGLANSITVAASVDPTQGGNAFLLRDGGISDTTDSNYTYNATGSAGYTDRIQQLLASLQSPMSFSGSAGLATSASISDFANSSVGWVQGSNQSAAYAAAYQSSLLSQAGAALNNATGVNLDAQLTNMLTIESSYTASAKLMTTVTDMLKTLLSAV